MDNRKRLSFPYDGGEVMEKKKSEKRGADLAVYMVKALLCSYIATGIMLVVLSLLLYKFGLSEENVNAGIVLTYIVSTFAGGFVIGKLTRKKKFIWGVLSGVFYFLLLLIISFGVYHSLQEEMTDLFIVFLMCAGGGMLGGMVS